MRNPFLVPLLPLGMNKGYPKKKHSGYSVSPYINCSPVIFSGEEYIRNKEKGNLNECSRHLEVLMTFFLTKASKFSFDLLNFQLLWRVFFVFFWFQVFFLAKQKTSTQFKHEAESSPFVSLFAQLSIYIILDGRIKGSQYLSNHFFIFELYCYNI